MISILIPLYNYNCLPLLQRLCDDMENFPKETEIIVRDDASSEHLIPMHELQNLSGVRYIRNERNLGRTRTRQLLLEDARFDILLFMDADVLPKYPDFLQRFYWEDESWGLQFGGVIYEDQKPEKEFMLRWKYGRKREQQSVKRRETSPYVSVNSGCILVRKPIFKELNAMMQHERYGMDIYFKELLMRSGSEVVHLDNPVYHLGLESSSEFLKKSLQAVDTTAELESKGLIQLRMRPLQKAYYLLKKFRLRRLYSFFITGLNGTMRRNFLSSRPNLFWFDLYRLNHFIQQKKEDA